MKFKARPSAAAAAEAEAEGAVDDGLHRRHHQIGGNSGGRTTRKGQQQHPPPSSEDAASAPAGLKGKQGEISLNFWDSLAATRGRMARIRR